MKIKLIIIILITFCCTAFAQQSVNIGSVSSITTCNADIYDNGGPNGAYSSLLDQSLTIYPENNSGRVSLTLISIDIHKNDTLYIYDSDNANGTPIAKLNNNNTSGISNQAYTASIENSSGALTIRFKTSFFSGWFGHGEGFKLHASCAPACQNFTLQFDTLLCSKLPYLNQDDNYYYIDLCPYEDLNLAVKCLFFNNNTNGYYQNDNSTTFKWIFSGDVISGVGLKTLNYDFEPSHGYDISITATDSMMCPANQPLAFRVRTSDNPVVHIGSMPHLCVNDVFVPTFGTNNNDNIVIKDVGSQQINSLVVSDTVFLPDGISCPPYGTFYRSNVTFTDFASGASLSSPNDLLYVRVKMEHSAIEDLKIKLYCPNNQSVTILPNPNYTFSDHYPQYFRVNLGSAYRPDGPANCNAALSPMGEPWNYVWSNNTTLGYQYAPGNGSIYNSQNFHAHYNPHWDYNEANYDYFGDILHSFSVDSSDIANNSNFYHPHQNFSNLIGCPLNGTWYIEVQDNEVQDNGYIVEWELALDPELLPSHWEYEVNIDSMYFETNGVKSDHIIPTTSGDAFFTLHTIDDFGCKFENYFTITTHDIPNANLGNDKTNCIGNDIELRPTTVENNVNYSWNTGSSQSAISVNTSGFYSLTASVQHNGNNLCSSSDTIEVILFDYSLNEITDVICENVDYQENGFNIPAHFLSGQQWYYDTLTFSNSVDCDSIVALKLEVLPKKSTELHENACLDYSWEGEIYTNSGTYQRTYSSAQGCDSVVTLFLEIGEPTINEISKEVCGRYIWAGDTITESGNYEKSFTSSHNCDSLVRLELTIIDTFLRLHSTNPDFCLTQETTLNTESQNFDSFLWNTGESTPTIEVTSSGKYIVTASNDICQKTLFVDIPYCELNLLIPNAITPGKPGNNDVLFLSDRIKHQIDKFSIQIYNRYGVLVFKSDDKNFIWDGKVNGILHLNAVYNYRISGTEQTGKKFYQTGSIVVL